MIKVLIPLTNGVEEIEAVIVIDTLRRAGCEVVSAGLRSGIVTASQGVKLIPDTEWDRLNPNSFDMIVLPGGGEGTETLCHDNRILETIRSFMASGKTVGAICAAPLVLHSAGVLDGRKVTCYPDVADQLTTGTWINKRVVIDGNLITSQAPGTTFEFALALVESANPEKTRETAAAMLVTI